MFRRSLGVFMVLLAAGFMLQACGGGGGSGAVPMGSAQISLTDAPGDFDHVWITVKEVRFHTSDAAGPNDPGWLTYPLATPVTVDLLTLNGTVGGAIWGNITLPAGNYQQIRLLLAGSDAALAPSASSLGLSYNDEVVVGPTISPLRIPDVSHGIKLSGVFSITAGGTLRLAIDFDAGHDVIDLGNGEYVLKPRLAYFDLDNVGAIVGRIDLGSAPSGTAHFVVKAERLNDPVSPAYYVVKRYTIVSIPSTTTIGTFVLYPVPAVATTNYDILIRGVGYETTIIRGVPVTRGSMPANNETTVPVISMTTGTDYIASGSIASPTGAWVNFYQTLDNTVTGTTPEYPYEIRYRHFHPLTGRFANYELSKSAMRFGAYDSSAISLQTVTPQEGVGAYLASAGALLYDRSALPGTPNITSLAPAVTFASPLTAKSGTVSSITGTIDMSGIPHADVSLLTKGYVFAVHGGMIVNSVDAGSTMSGGGGSYAIPDLAGGFGGAFYGVEAIGWDPGSPMTIRAIAFPPGFVNLSSGGDATGVTMNMYPF